MKDEIKRSAQFLFDNAEFISKELARSGRYRTVEIKFSHFKHGGGTRKVDLGLYDEVSGVYRLEDGQITIRRFKQICRTMNEEAKAIPVPMRAEIRESLG